MEKKQKELEEDENKAVREEKAKKKQQQEAESRREETARKEEETKEEKARQALLAAEALKSEKQVLINLGVKTVSCTESVLRNEHNSLLYHKAVKAQQGQELSCLMTEATWDIVLPWLLS